MADNEEIVSAAANVTAAGTTAGIARQQVCLVTGAALGCVGKPIKVQRAIGGIVPLMVATALLGKTLRPRSPGRRVRPADFDMREPS